MGLPLLDVVVIAVYLLLCVAIGIRAGGKPSDTSAYFKTDGKVPWWAVSLSVVATETSMLTVISIPAVAYLGSFVFLQIVFGYILGRMLIAWFILPAYFSGSQKTAYTFLGERFGPTFQRLISLVFLATRLLADGVRLFAAAIPIKVITGLDYPLSIAIIASLTLAYTYYGGLKSVIWIDVLQLIVYTFGGAFVVWFALQHMSAPLMPMLAEAGKLQLIDWPDSLSAVFATPYNLIGAVIGGMFLSMASHGVDHLMVQRLLACGETARARVAVITSGWLVLVQFILFLFAGMAIYGFYNGLDIQALGIAHADEILLKFVHEQVPAGIAGLLIAGLFAAAMSTLSSSLSALSSSTMYDVFPRWAESKHAMRISRAVTLGWTLVFFLFAISFSSTDNPVVELGLAIAGFTYGALLGAFFAGRYTRLSTLAATTALIVCVLSMASIIFLTNLAFPWYTLTGVLIFFAVAIVTDVLQRSAGRSGKTSQEHFRG